MMLLSLALSVVLMASVQAVWWTTLPRSHTLYDPLGQQMLTKYSSKQFGGFSPCPTWNPFGQNPYQHATTQVGINTVIVQCPPNTHTIVFRSKTCSSRAFTTNSVTDSSLINCGTGYPPDFGAWLMTSYDPASDQYYVDALLEDVLITAGSLPATPPYRPFVQSNVLWHDYKGIPYPPTSDSSRWITAVAYRTNILRGTIVGNHYRFNLVQEMPTNTTMFCVLQSGVAIMPVLDGMYVARLVVRRLTPLNETHIFFRDQEQEYTVDVTTEWPMGLLYMDCGHGNTPFYDGYSAYNQTAFNKAEWYHKAQINHQFQLDLRTRQLSITTNQVQLDRVFNFPLPYHSSVTPYYMLGSNHTFFVNPFNLQWGNTFWIELMDYPAFPLHVVYAGDPSWPVLVRPYRNSTSFLRIQYGPYMWHRKVPNVTGWTSLPPIPVTTAAPTSAPTPPHVSPTLAPGTPTPSPTTPASTPCTASSAATGDTPDYYLWLPAVTFVAGIVITLALMCTYQYRSRQRQSGDDTTSYVSMGSV